MTTSQNGWPASSDKHAIGIANPTVHGVDFPNGVRGGDVQTVLMYVAEQFHAHVEPLHDGWCWGYDYRGIDGSSDLSNHASGTAIDLNAPKHPMGKSGTYSASQVKAIRSILANCDGVVRWGGDYSGRKDEMHFEIVKGSAAVARLAGKLRGEPSPPASTPKPGTRPAPGPAVAFPLPAGWYFGPKDGPDRSVSGYYGRTFRGHPDHWWLQQFANQLGRRGWSVGKGRTYLHRHGNDGRYGAEYRALIVAFQRDQHLDPDGLLGVHTWNAAYRNPVT